MLFSARRRVGDAEYRDAERDLPLATRARLPGAARKAPAGLVMSDRTQARLPWPNPTLLSNFQRFDRLLERAIAALGVGVALAVVRKRAPDLDIARGRAIPPGRHRPASQEHRQIAAIDHAAARARGLDEIAEFRIQLRRPTGDVQRRDAVAAERAETGARSLRSSTRAVGPGIDVAMAARLVAQLADVDLEDLDARRARAQAGRARERPSNRGAPVLSRSRRSCSAAAANGWRGSERGRAACTSRAFRRVPHLHAVHERRAAADRGGTWTASVICSRSEPFSRHAVV